MEKYFIQSIIWKGQPKSAQTEIGYKISKER
jgi:hypothetical protein